MKKRILYFLFILSNLIFYLQVNAQTYIGFRGGVNFANVLKSGDRGAIIKDRIVAPNIEFHFAFSLPNNFAIQPEVHYIQRGFRRDISLTNDWIYKINYINFTLLGKYQIKSKPVKGKRRKRKRYETSGYIIAGPYIGRAGSIKLKNKFNNVKKDYGDGNGISIEEKKDFGIIGGGGVLLSNRRMNFVLDFRYSRSFKNLNDHKGPDGYLRNTGIIISAGIEFPITR